MAILPVLVAPDPRLAKKALPVEKIGPEELQLIHDMLETLYAEDAVGLAATQVNVQKRIIVMDTEGTEHEHKPRVLINPVILEKSSQKVRRDEACLSVASYYGPVERSAEVTVKYLDETGKEHVVHATGLLARCIQHEIDHLNGILFIDYLSSLRRSMALRKSSKIKRYRMEE